MTPLEAWSGTKPDVSHLRTFGCSAFAHVAKAERSNLTPNRKYMLLGYGSSQKDYYLYNLDHMKVIHSRDVVFDESSTPGLQETVT